MRRASSYIVRAVAKSPAGASDERHSVQRGGSPELIAHLPGQGQTLSAQRRGTSVVALVMGEDARAGQRPRARRLVADRVGRWQSTRRLRKRQHDR